MFFGNGSAQFYIPEGATREVPYNGSQLQLTNLHDTLEIVPPWYDIVAGESTVDGRSVLVAVALKRGIYSSSNGKQENLCEPIPESLTDAVVDRMKKYRDCKKPDAEIIVIPQLSQI